MRVRSEKSPLRPSAAVLPTRGIKSRRRVSPLLPGTAYHIVNQGCVVRHSKNWPTMSARGVRRAKAALSSGCKPNRSSRKQPEQLWR
jgi:hypothetical protein